MANPVIKEEESPELSVMEVPPESAIANTAVTLVASGENDIKLPRPMLLSAVERMFSRPSFYYSNSPHARATTTVLKTASPAVTATPAHSGGAVKHDSSKREEVTIEEETDERSEPFRMNNNNNQNGARGVSHDELQFPILPQTVDAHAAYNDLGAMPTVNVDQLQSHGQVFENSQSVTEESVNQQNMLLGELVTCSANLHSKLQGVFGRLDRVENENAYFRSVLSPHIDSAAYGQHPAPAVRPSTAYRGDRNGRSRSPSPTPHGYREREDRLGDEGAVQDSTANSGKKGKGRKALKIAIPGKSFGTTPGIGLPTPSTRTASTLFAPTPAFAPTPTLSTGMPQTPVTPGRIGPPNPNRKPTTAIMKRKNHSLDKIMPPPYVQMPLIPLTDTEVVVFFFQSLSRPIVALRLYARNWGPRDIVDVLHDHRDIEPPYLRNTCSVKCTTAIKLGKRLHGDHWEESYKAVLSQADDNKATDMIHLAGEEVKRAVDYEIKSLCLGLKKYPQDGVDGGIFSQCVKYCYDNDANYTLQNVSQLASALLEGRVPEHPPPVPKRVHVPHVMRGSYHEHDDDTDTSDEESGTPSPTKNDKTTTGRADRAANPAS